MTAANPHSVGLGIPISHSPVPISEPEHRVDRRLGQQIVAETFRALVQQQRRLLDVLRPGQPDEAVADVFLVEQDEDHEDDRQFPTPAGISNSDRMNERGEHRTARCRPPGSGPAPALGLTGRSGKRACRRLSLGHQLLAQRPEQVGCPFDRAAIHRRAADRADLFDQIGLVARQFAGQLDRPRCDVHADRAGYADSQHGGNQNRQDTPRTDRRRRRRAARVQTQTARPPRAAAARAGRNRVPPPRSPPERGSNIADKDWPDCARDLRHRSGSFARLPDVSSPEPEWTQQETSPGA